jgi:MFS transporter, ACS family, pantothenate transporter
VPWLKSEEKQLALDRMKRAGRSLEEHFTLVVLEWILGKWHFWVYTAYYTQVWRPTFRISTLTRLQVLNL